MMSAFIQQAILLAGMPMLIVYACFSDLFRMTISNRLCLAIAAMFFVYALLVGMPTGQFFNHLLAGAAVLAFSFALFAFGWIGGGDAKFVAVLAIWLGFGQLWEYLAISSLLGGALTLALLFARNHPLPSPLFRLPWVNRLHDRQTGVPYGIALGIAAMMLLPQSAVWRSLV
jgi:prepilin peptidase CpaA